MSLKKNRSIALAFVAGISVTLFLVSLPAWALSCNACVDASDIVDGQVKAAEIATGAVGTSELAAGAVRATDLGRLPAARVCSSAQQAISHNVDTTLSFDTEAFDSSGMHSAASPSRLTAPIAGIYDVTATVQWAANSTGYRKITLRKNGAVTFAQTLGTGGSSGATTSVSSLVSLAAGGYVETRVGQDSGGSLNASGSTSGCPYPALEMHLVSAP